MLKSGTLNGRHIVDWNGNIPFEPQKGQLHINTSGVVPRFFPNDSEQVVRPTEPTYGSLVVCEVSESGAMIAWTLFSTYRAALLEIRDREVRTDEAAKVFEEYIELLRSVFLGGVDFFQEVDLGCLASAGHTSADGEYLRILDLEEVELVRIFDLRVACVEAGISDGYTLYGAVELARMPSSLMARC